jgi:hypothetical protein
MKLRPISTERYQVTFWHIIKQMGCLYVEECKKQDLVYAKQAKYREMFCNSYIY